MMKKMKIRRRIFLLLLAAGALSFLVLASVFLWGIYDARQETMETGRHMGVAAGESMERVIVHQGQKRLSAVAKEKAHVVDRELRTLKEDTEYVALMMERMLSRPEGHPSRSLKSAENGTIARAEAYIYLSPGVRSPEARAAFASELDKVSGIADTLENMARSYEGYQGYVVVASKKGYMFSADMLPPEQEYVYYPEEAFSTFVPQERPWYQKPMQAGKSTVGDIYVSVEGFPSLSYGMPYRDGKEFAGVANITLSLQSLYQSMTDKGLSASDINFILNDKGEVVLSSEKEGVLAADDSHRDLRQSSEGSLVEKAKSMVAGHNGVVSLTLNGERYYLAYEPIPSMGWSLGTMVKAGDIIAPAQEARASVRAEAEDFAVSMEAFFRRNLWEMEAILLVILAVLAEASQLAAERFVQPILALTEGVRDIARGNLDKKLDIRTGDEIEELSDSVNHMAGELKDYMANVARVTADKQRIATELSLASGIQEGMLPTVFPKVTDGSSYEIFATMEAAKSVGGDFYDFYGLDKEHLAITMADVSGKGVPAALFMMISKTILKNNALMAAHANPAVKVDWAAIMELSNRQLCENNEEMMFVTVFFGVMNIKTGEFVYANGGHNAPLLGRVTDGKTDWQY
ncbi:MAG: SpoIIE family protein phosphatase, partial [Selenomonadaceae bacterium]|nr:SpoIIE family protein phosphatase [Selenomonadaceae bacterium]